MSRWTFRGNPVDLVRLAFIAGAGVVVAASALQERGLRRPDFAAHLEVEAVRTDTGAVIPVRVYLFKDEQPFRLSPVDSMLPLRVDLFYRERLWQKTDRPKTLEVTVQDVSHVILLDGQATFDLPAGNEYRLEAYHGLFYQPAVVEFTLQPEERRRIQLRLTPIAPDRQQQWISADGHIHLMRAQQDDYVFLRWLQAEDLSVGNFLELQRQQHAAVQYSFGEAGEARLPGYSIRSGHESRSRFYGHTLFLGPREMIRPLSVGLEYANAPEAYPFPAVLFDRGRRTGAVVGFAHFDGGQPNSALIMNLARNGIDFVEVFQMGVLQTQPWYELLNAGFRVVGLAGSDFPVSANRRPPLPRSVPLLGPERALVKRAAQQSAYEAWAEGVRSGNVLLSNGPLLEFSLDGESAGSVIVWGGPSTTVTGTATAIFHRAIQRVEVIVNGRVAARSVPEPGQTEVSLPFTIQLDESSWIAARTQADRLDEEPEIWAHTNPIYVLKEGEPVYVKKAREAIRQRWEEEALYYSDPSLVFGAETQRSELLQRVNETRKILEQPQPPWSQ